MMKNYKIGIVGNGFVGSAILHGFILHVDDIMIHDIDPKRSTHTMKRWFMIQISYLSVFQHQCLSQVIVICQ